MIIDWNILLLKIIDEASFEVFIPTAVKKETELIDLQQIAVWTFVLHARQRRHFDDWRHCLSCDFLDKLRCNKHKTFKLVIS